MDPAGEDRSMHFDTQASPAESSLPGDDRARTGLAVQSASATDSRLPEQGTEQVSVAARHPGGLTERRAPAVSKRGDTLQASRLAPAIAPGGPTVRQDGIADGTAVVYSGRGAVGWHQDAGAEHSDPANLVSQAASPAVAPGAQRPAGRAPESENRSRPASPGAAVGGRHAAALPAATESADQSPSGQRSRIDQLLARAERALERYRLLVPARDNAYGYYQEVFALEPGHPQARAGMGRIVDRYVSLVEQAIKADDEDKARLYVARGLRVREDDPRLLALRETVSGMSRVVLSQEPEPRPDAQDEVWPAPEPEPEAKPATPPADDVTKLLLKLRDFFTRNGAGSTVQSRSLASDGN
jgi:hypothetical protein